MPAEFEPTIATTSASCTFGRCHHCPRVHSPGYPCDHACHGPAEPVQLADVVAAVVYDGEHGEILWVDAEPPSGPPEEGLGRLWCTAMVPDSNEPGIVQVWFSRDVALTQPSLTAALEQVRGVLADYALHEIDEHLRYNGTKPFDSHAEDR